MFFYKECTGSEIRCESRHAAPIEGDSEGMQDIFQEADAHWPGPAECDQASDFGEEPVALMALLARLD